MAQGLRQNGGLWGEGEVSGSRERQVFTKWDCLNQFLFCRKVRRGEGMARE